MGKERVSYVTNSVGNDCTPWRIQMDDVTVSMWWAELAAGVLVQTLEKI